MDDKTAGVHSPREAAATWLRRLVGTHEKPGPRKEGGAMPSRHANVKNEKQYEALKDKGTAVRRSRIAHTDP